jgi:serpin B
MKKIQWLGVTMVFLLTLLGCDATAPNPTPNPPKLGVRERALVQSSNRFGFSLFKEVVAESNGGNVFVSPLSVSMALGMTYNGSASATQDAMKTVLGFEGLSEEQINGGYRTLIDYLSLLDPGVQMEIANSIWYRQTLDVLQAFVDVNRINFDALVSSLNFDDPGAADTINAWVNEKTRGKISGIVDKPIDPALVMFLINAVYFKGDWTYRFDVAKTAPDTFHAPSGDRTVSMMSLHGDKLPYMETSDFQAIDLPYGSGAFSLAILVPAAGHTVEELASTLTPENWATWSGSFTVREGDVFLPRFTLEYKTSLKAALVALGMGVAFDSTLADFTRIRTAGELFISDVKHKTCVRVDEVGTEAAAVTSVEIGVTSMPLTFTVRVDRPFLIVLHDKNSEALLFMGRIVDPSSM